MKLVYLAPEIPALSATFVYNELLAVEALGHEIIPVSIHKPAVPASDAKLDGLKKAVSYLYPTSKWNVLTSHFKLLFSRPTNYFQSFARLVSDIVYVGIVKRDAFGLLYRFFYAAQLANLLLAEKVEHVHVHFAHVPTDIAMYATKMAGISYSVMAHANDIFERGLLIKQKVNRALFFATISDFNRRFIESNYQIESDKLVVVRCGVDTDVFKEKDNKKMSSPLRLGSVGRLVEKKGLSTLIKAAVVLEQSDTDFIIEIAGSGPLEQQLKSLVEKLGLENRVNFLGALAHDQVADFVRNLDIFVLPCIQDRHGDMDGIPVVLMEAMMVGTPVISTKLSGIPELIINDSTGLLIEPDDEVALANAVLRLRNENGLSHSLTKQGICKVRQEFAQDINAKRLENYFLTAL